MELKINNSLACIQTQGLCRRYLYFLHLKGTLLVRNMFNSVTAHNLLTRTTHFLFLLLILLDPSCFEWASLLTRIPYLEGYWGFTSFWWCTIIGMTRINKLKLTQPNNENHDDEKWHKFVQGHKMSWQDILQVYCNWTYHCKEVQTVETEG